MSKAIVSQINRKTRLKWGMSIDGVKFKLRGDDAKYLEYVSLVPPDKLGDIVEVLQRPSTWSRIIDYSIAYRAYENDVEVSVTMGGKLR